MRRGIPDTDELEPTLCSLRRCRNGRPRSIAAAIMSNTTIKVLCYKSLTHSDVTTEIAKSGRLVLPRAQVTACLQRLLALGSAGGAPGKGRAGSLCGAVPLVRERGCCRPNCPNPGPGLSRGFVLVGFRGRSRGMAGSSLRRSRPLAVHARHGRQGLELSAEDMAQRCGLWRPGNLRAGEHWYAPEGARVHPTVWLVCVHTRDGPAEFPATHSSASRKGNEATVYLTFGPPFLTQPVLCTKISFSREAGWPSASRTTAWCSAPTSSRAAISCSPSWRPRPRSRSPPPPVLRPGPPRARISRRPA